MELHIKLNSMMLPRLLIPGGERLYLNAVKTSQNKALGSARAISADIAEERYGLPRTSYRGAGPTNPYAKPSIKSVISKSPVRDISGIQQGISSKLFANKKRMSTIRFMTSPRTPIKQKGIPRAERKQRVVVTLSKRQFISKKKFVQRGSNRRLSVFRSVETTRKWLMLRNTVAPIASVIRKEKPQVRMKEAAEREFRSEFQKQFEKNLM
ncbi:hypothetical protein [Pseudobacteriovorax antillogorgiicola]|uniref:Uncharacterized protein n=1 Tax=Pseudobacteriovorax antillogorgiicola TaxID=1513793 RepID=A0A1Y6C554_9BACT|nr:hypothetical protein [Pseudobacteriovorax antillogorgiicola]TCS43377.1 hypothetical protein EDD56_13717 [Pseudobacteriovorax antillogorgiicola]SMF34999.1 hypothetical protein SAMN06296036_110191 [Pseudobacteriovorax antillogorgiicola]